MSLTERYAARQHGFTRTVRRSAVGLLMALLVANRRRLVPDVWHGRREGPVQLRPGLGVRAR